MLDKFAETRDKLKSFIAKSEASSKYKGTFTKNVELQHYSAYDSRYDGKRACVRQNDWGDVNPTEHFTKEQALYASHLWNGTDCYEYNRGKRQEKFSKGLVFLHENSEDKKRPRRISTIGYSPVSLSMGNLPLDTELVDSIVRQADSVFVRDKMEKIGDSDCYVIQAKAKSGSYKLWIDPNHGYNIAKAEVRKGPGDVLGNGYVLPQNDNFFVFLKNVRFEKVGDLWVSMEADYGHRRNFPNGDYYTQSQHYKITEMVLNPDHEALHSFVPDNIVNGAMVYILDHKDSRGGLIKYKWQDGDVVDDNGKVIMICYKKAK